MSKAKAGSARAQEKQMIRLIRYDHDAPVLRQCLIVRKCGNVYYLLYVSRKLVEKSK